MVSVGSWGELTRFLVLQVGRRFGVQAQDTYLRALPAFYIYMTFHKFIDFLGSYPFH